MTPSIDRTFYQFLTSTDLDLVTEYDFLPNCARYATGAACQQRTLTPSGHLVLYHLGFALIPPNRNHTTYLWRLPNRTYLPNFTLPNWRGFNRIYATGVACQQGTLTPPDTWSCPTLGLACVLMSRPILQPLLNLSCLRTLNFEHTSALLFCFVYKMNVHKIRKTTQNATKTFDCITISNSSTSSITR